MQLRGGMAAIGGAMFAFCAQAATYGPIGAIGPEAAPARTCAGNAQCTVVNPSGAWQAAITGADPGDTILLQAGTYNASGTINVPAGSSTNPITIANHEGGAVTINGGLTLNSHAVIQGLRINRGTGGSYAIEIDRRSSTPKQNITLRYLDVLGGTSEAIRIRGNVLDLTIDSSLLDGGRDHHVVKVLCDDNSDVQPPSISCNWAPEVTITNNRFSKTRAFPTSLGEDLLQFEGAGDSVVSHNEFTDNPNGEDCVDWKPQGGAGTSVVFNQNHLHACNAQGLLMHQSESDGSTVIEGNYFEGSGQLLRRVHAGTQVINNIFDSSITVSASNLTVGFNTFLGNFKFGDDSQGPPNNLTLINNIFSATRFSCTSVGCGSYSATRNVVYQTSGSFSCQNCISTDPLLSSYQIKEGSSAQDMASSQFLVARDIEGTKRPQGSNAEIGAFEIAADGDPPPAPTASLSADPEEVDEGQSSTLTWNSTNAGECIGTGFPTGGATSGETSVSPILTTVYELNCDGALSSTTVTVNQAPMPGQQPFAANVVPGVIQAEDYDLGGEGVAYHDTGIGNKGGEYRSDDVDIKANTYDDGYTVGWGDTGEWLEQTIDVQKTGEYQISAFAGTNDITNPSFTLSIDGVPLANVPAPNTGSWDVKQHVLVGTVNLSAGPHLLRVDVDRGFVDFDHFEFAEAVPPPTDDANPPSVAILAPFDGATVSRRTRTLVQIDATDAESGVDQVVLRIEGVIVATFSGSGGHAYSWLPMGRRNRQAVIEATATDVAGNASSDRITVTVRR
jgi:hypothetical protein